MKIAAARSAVISFMFCDVVVDDFWRLKNHLHIDSPVNRSRLDYWLAIEELFDWLPPRDVTYWKTPPTLELPERAQSLSDWSHCCWCGFPLAVAFVDCIEIQERGFVRNEL